MNKIKVLLVDDSAVVRQVLKQIINAHPKMEVSAAAQDPIFAMRYMQKQWPDVIILDVEMPRMDGLTFLKKLMKEYPDTHMQVYQYIFYMSCPNPDMNPFFNFMRLYIALILKKQLIG